MSAVVVVPKARQHTPPALPHWEFLPGGVMKIHVAPAPKWPVVHRNIRGLHGLVTNHLAVPHTPMQPRFALMPYPDGIGWAVYVPDEDLALSVAAMASECELYGRPGMIRMSPMRRVPAPDVRHAVSDCLIRTITPISVRWGERDRVDPMLSKRERRTNRVSLGVDALISTIATWLPSRCGLSWQTPEMLGISVRLLSESTRLEVVHCGGKLGKVTGYEGQMILRCCPVSRWLLDAAQTVGLGGRTAFGFGRVTVTDA